MTDQQTKAPGGGRRPDREAFISTMADTPTPAARTAPPRAPDTVAEIPPSGPSPQTLPPPGAFDLNLEKTHEAPRRAAPYSRLTLTRRLAAQLEAVSKEVWLVLSLLAIALVLNRLVAAQRAVLGFYTLPTLYSAYVYGRRHATLTAMASVFLVGFMAAVKPDLIGNIAGAMPPSLDFVAWGGMLVLTAYAMGTLHERHRKRVDELRQTYHGLLHILRHFISNDKHTESHCYRVSIYATRIAACLGLSASRVEDIRAAALLHDIGKMEVSRELLHKAARLTQEEFEVMKRHVEHGSSLLEPVGGPLRRIIPIILAHHDRFDGSGYNEQAGEGMRSGEEIPIEARIIAVADVYDSLTSDRPYRRAISPFEAREAIIKGSGGAFDPRAVQGFLCAFDRGEMEIPEMLI